MTKYENKEDKLAILEIVKTAIPSMSKVLVNGKEIAFDAYNAYGSKIQVIHIPSS